MLGFKHRRSPDRQGDSHRRAIETLESRQLLSGGPPGPHADFATHEMSRPVVAASAAPAIGDVHAPAASSYAPGRPDAVRSSFGGVADDMGTRDALRNPRAGSDSPNVSGWGANDRRGEALRGDNWGGGRGTPDLWQSDSPVVNGVSGAGTSGFGSTPLTGGEKVLVLTPVPVKVMVAASTSAPSMFVLVVPRGFPADAGYEVQPTAQSPAGRQPAAERARGAERAQAAAERHEPARAGMERATQPETRQAATPEARSAKPGTAANAAATAAAAQAPAVKASSSEADRARVAAAAVVGAMGHVVDAATVARAAGAIAAAGRGANVVAVDYAAAAAWQGLAGRVEAVVAKLTGLVEAAASVGDAFDAVAVAADASDIGSGLLYLPTGPTMFLGLAPMTMGSAHASWWPSQQAWRVTEAVSLVIAVAGYGYCRADAERRRARPVPVRSGIVATRRPADGL